MHTQQHVYDYYQGLIAEAETDLLHLRNLHTGTMRIIELADEFVCNLQCLDFNKDETTYNSDETFTSEEMSCSADEMSNSN